MKIQLFVACSFLLVLGTQAMAKTCQPVISVTGEGLDSAAAQYDARLNWSFNAQQFHGRPYSHWAQANRRKVTVLKLKENKWTATAAARPCIL